MKFKVSHLDANGILIPDISRITLPSDLSLLIFKTITGNAKKADLSESAG